MGSQSRPWIFSHLRDPRDRSWSFLPSGFCVTGRWALTSMGSPLDAGRRIARLIGAAEPRVIRAYHGSPHSFSRFDASKIGTGEGAQAYGHGLYFAGNEGVAQQYRDGFSGALLVDGQPANLTPTQGEWARMIMDGKAEQQAAMYQAMLEVASRKRQELRAMQAADPVLFADTPGNISALGTWSYQADRAADELEIYNSLAGRSFDRSKAHMYEVEIGYPEQALLDHDSPFMTPAGSVAAEVLRAHNPAAISPRTLREIQSGEWRFISPSPQYGNPYQRAATELHGLARTQGGSAALAEAGIPGIRYLDQGSRSSGEGTRNYVMFPGTEDRIRILRQYGLLPPLVGAVMMEED